MPEQHADNPGCSVRIQGGQGVLERVLLSPSCRTSHVQPGVFGVIEGDRRAVQGPPDTASSPRTWARSSGPQQEIKEATYLIPGWEQDGSSEPLADAARRCDRTSATVSELRKQPYAPRSLAGVLSSGRRGHGFGSSLPMLWLSRCPDSVGIGAARCNAAAYGRPTVLNRPFVGGRFCVWGFPANCCDGRLGGGVCAR